MKKTIILCFATLFFVQAKPLAKSNGYRGIWYHNEVIDEPYRYKYSGGLGTFPQTHMPTAYYSKEANKTFFCYGGTLMGHNQMMIMISYYDHATGMVPRPRVLIDKKTDDPHETATLTLDDKGFIWIFSNAHGAKRPAFVHKSTKPYSIDEFKLVKEQNFSYMQPWFFPGKGFLLLHTLYSPGRFLFSVNSSDGVDWGPPKPIARFGLGHYSVSWQHDSSVGLAFNYHPDPGGLNARTNLYYMQTQDWGKSWITAAGMAVDTPLLQTHNVAMIHDYQAEGLLVYLKNLEFDEMGRPVILYLTSKGWQPDPAFGPRTWNTAQWNGKTWDIRPVTVSDNNYDFGSLYIESDGTWRIIAPTDPGPEPNVPGGEVVMWTSRDSGKTWLKAKRLTRNSPREHSYVRKPWNAQPDFYAFWADGEALHLSESSLYFTNRNGDHVWRLPEIMTGEFAKPEVAW